MGILDEKGRFWTILTILTIPDDFDRSMRENVQGSGFVRGFCSSRKFFEFRGIDAPKSFGVLVFGVHFIILIMAREYYYKLSQSLP